MLYLIVFWAGVMVGVGLMSFFAVRAFDRGVREGRETEIARRWKERAEWRASAMQLFTDDPDVTAKI